MWYSGWKFNEWQSISVYATDVLLFILIIFWAFNFKKFNFKKYEYFLFVLIFISGISIKNSIVPAVSWFQLVKLIEFIVFYFYLSRYAFNKFGLVNVFQVVLLSGVFQAILAILQFLKQSDLGLRYLGESMINNQLLGIASFYLPTGEKIIRSYGTTPHPNVLSTFLFLGMFSFYVVYLYSKLHSDHEPLADKWDVLVGISYCIILFAFFTTFSRVVVFIWFVSFCIRSAIIRIFRHYRLVFGTKEGRKRIKFILLSSLFVIVLFSSLYFTEIISRTNIGSEDQAVKLRSLYNEEALKIRNPFGVGLGSFVGWLMDKDPLLLTYYYQPVHNIYLLIYSEIGIFGLLAFVVFAGSLLRDFILKTRLKKSYHLSSLVFFSSLLFIGFFDHFLWTLQQGRIIFWFTMALLTYLSKDDIMVE